MVVDGGGEGGGRGEKEEQAAGEATKEEEEAAGEATKEKGATRRGRGKFEDGECIPPGGSSSSICAEFELIMELMDSRPTDQFNGQSRPSKSHNSHFSLNS